MENAEKSPYTGWDRFLISFWKKNTSGFPMMNIHEHQVKFMEDFEKQGGISFIILFYSHRNEIYYLPFTQIKAFFERSINGGRKSFRFEEIDKAFKLKSAPGAPVHYLEGIQRDLSLRDS